MERLYIKGKGMGNGGVGEYSSGDWICGKEEREKKRERYRKQARPTL